MAGIYEALRVPKMNGTLTFFNSTVTVDVYHEPIAVLPIVPYILTLCASLAHALS